MALAPGVFSAHSYGRSIHSCRNCFPLRVATDLAASAHRPCPRFRPRRIRRFLNRCCTNPFRRNSRLLSFHRNRPRWSDGDRQSGRCSRGRNARARASLRRLFGAASRLPHARVRTHGNSRRHPYECSGRNQSELSARRAGPDSRPHQSAGNQSSSRRQTTTASACAFPT